MVEMFTARRSCRSCCHEKADARIIFHLHQIITQMPQHYVSEEHWYICVSITIMLHVIRGQKISQECGWMLACPVPTLVGILILAIWYTICHLHHLHDALSGLNAFTGTDFKSSIMNKGKVKALELMDVLAKLVESTELLCGLMFCVAFCLCSIWDA